MKMFQAFCDFVMNIITVTTRMETVTHTRQIAAANDVCKYTSSFQNGNLSPVPKPKFT
jgi:hypothetical protein